MLIKALCDYSALQENKTPAGYCEQAVHFEILLTPQGKIAAINDLRVSRIIPLKNKKTKTVYDPVMEQLPVITQTTFSSSASSVLTRYSSYRRTCRS